MLFCHRSGVKFHTVVISRFGTSSCPVGAEVDAVRFADYVVVDGENATAPFLHTAGDCHLRVVVRLKENLPELWQAARRRFHTKLQS